MTIYSAIYILAGLALLITELWAIWAKDAGRLDEGQSLSHVITRWIKGNPGKRRWIVGLGLVWVLWHLVFQHF